MKTIYTAHVTSTGGRDGKVVSDDNKLSLQLARPDSASGTNPEQLFAAGYSACFTSALTSIAKKKNMEVSNLSVTADVQLNEDEGSFTLGVTMNVKLPQMKEEQAEELVVAAHQKCPYSKAIHGNIDVHLMLNGHPLTAKVS